MSTPTTVLVAEDTELGRWALEHALQARGFVVYTAATWVEALGWLGHADVSVAVVSASMEPQQGPEMCAFVQANHPSTRLVLLAAEDDVREVRGWCGAGTPVFAKPIDVEQVVGAVQGMIEDGRSAMRA
jgi:DNA-binding NtrC family response regulator